MDVQPSSHTHCLRPSWKFYSGAHSPQSHLKLLLILLQTRLPLPCPAPLLSPHPLHVSPCVRRSLSPSSEKQSPEGTSAGGKQARGKSRPVLFQLFALGFSQRAALTIPVLFPLPGLTILSPPPTLRFLGSHQVCIDFPLHVLRYPHCHPLWFRNFTRYSK